MGRAGVLTCASVFIWAGAAFAQDAGQDPASVCDCTLTTQPAPVALSPANVTGAPQRKGRTRSVQLLQSVDSGMGSDGPPLRLSPALEIGAVASSNADQVRGGTKGDVGLRLAPRLDLQTNWSRHEWTAHANSKFDYFFGSDDLIASDAHVDSAFRLDIRHDTRALLDAFYDLSTNSDNRSKLDQSYGASASIEHDFGGLAASVKLGLRRDVSGLGSDRTYFEPSLTVRGTLLPDAITHPFIEASYAPRFHDRKRDRNSSGGEIAAGLEFDNGPFLTGEFAGVWQYRDFKASSVKTINAFGARGRMTWTPTESTRFSIGSDLKISESALNADVARQWSADTKFEQAVHDGLVFFADASALIEHGKGSNDTTLSSDAGLRWFVNPYVGLSLAYENEFSFGGKKSDDFTDHRLIASILLRP